MENQPQTPPPYQQSTQVPLPNATAVLVLGIIAIVGCFCYGLPGLICGVIALVLAKKDLKLYAANPSHYTPGSLSNIKSGRVCAIIGLSLAALYILVLLLSLAFLGTAILSDPSQMFDHMR